MNEGTWLTLSGAELSGAGCDTPATIAIAPQRRGRRADSHCQEGLVASGLDTVERVGRPCRYGTLTVQYHSRLQ